MIYLKNKNYFKAPRLKDFSYEGSYAYFVTICTHNKETYFKDEQIINMVLGFLKEVIYLNHFSLYAYCFMPDHLHLLLIGSESAAFAKLMKEFKQKTGYYFKSQWGKSLWQRSYYDHVLRKEESLYDIALYIFSNPVRKGLVNDFRDYKNLGSFVFEIEGRT